MLILIEKDPKNLIPREVADLDEAQALAATFPVHIQLDDGTTQPLAKYLADTAISEPPVKDSVDDEAARLAAETIAFDKSGLTEAKWKKLPAAERAKLIDAELKA